MDYKDNYGNEIKVGQRVAYAHNHGVFLGVVTKLNPKSVRVAVQPTSPNSKWGPGTYNWKTKVQSHVTSVQMLRNLVVIHEIGVTHE